MSDDIKKQADKLALQMMGIEEGSTPYVFFREGMFYPIGLRDDADAVQNALWNPGTIRVENMITGEVVWERTVQ